ncbi:hypothetical protein DV737_g4245, partial [Chaetothyriales sp. CBS 132003]
MAGSGNPELQRLLATLNSYAPRVQPTAGLGTSSSSRRHRSISSIVVLTKQSISSIVVLKQSISSIVVIKQSISSIVVIKQSISSIVVIKQSLSSIVVIKQSISSIVVLTKQSISSILTLTNQPSPASIHSEQPGSTRQWHSGREALVALHESRHSTSAQVSALLRSLGGKDAAGSSSSINSSSTEADNKAELAAYDAKVYRSLVAMQADFDRQLRNLGVPFFAISHDLVVKDGESVGAGHKLDKGELRELQKRMLDLLEDFLDTLASD